MADVVEEHRTHLLRVAYRLTGSLADAQDAVQEAWLRLAQLPDADRAAIRDPRGWLTTVVGRLCPCNVSATLGRGCPSHW